LAQQGQSDRWLTSAAIWEMIDSTEQPNEHLEKIAQEAVEEARMVLPGIQGAVWLSAHRCVQ
jgi:hypothetical protein